MLGRVKDLLGLGRDEVAGPADAQEELRLAAAAILAEAALIDGHLDRRESDRLSALLTARFALSPQDAQALAARAMEVAACAVDWNRFTRVLQASFDEDERIAMMEMLWQVVLADGELHAYEDSLVRRIAGLLQVSDRDRALARRRAQAQLAR